MKKTKSKYLIFPGIVLLIFFIIMLLTRNLNKGTVYNGTISDGTITSGVTDSLYYVKKDNVFINLDRLDDLTDLSVVKIDNKYHLVTAYHQVTVDPNDGSYYFDSVKIQDKTEAPEIINNAVYADMDTIFYKLGYDVSSTVLKKQKLVSCLLIRLQDIDDYDYERLKVKPLTENTAKDVPQKESDQLNNGSDTVPTPDPSETVSAEDAEKAINDGLNNASSLSQTEESVPEYTEIYSDMSNVNPAQETEPAQKTESSTYSNPNNIMSDQEFEKEWKETASKVADALKGRPTNGTIREGFSTSESGDYVKWNTEPVGYHASTISILENPSTDYNEFIIATFRYDWSDYADEINDDPEAKAYYLSIPETYHRVWRALLGADAGDELFNYIKPLADRKTIDPKTGLEIADGMQSQTIDFSSWLDRKTEKGIRYSVLHYGDGIQISFYKD